MTDDETLHARQIALTGVVMAMLNHLSEADPKAAGDVQITAGNYINDRAPEGSAVHQEALNFLRLTLFSNWKRHP